MKKLIKTVEATKESDGCYREFNYTLKVTKEAIKDTKEGYKAHEGYGKYN